MLSSGDRQSHCSFFFSPLASSRRLTRRAAAGISLGYFCYKVTTSCCQQSRPLSQTGRTDDITDYKRNHCMYGDAWSSDILQSLSGADQGRGGGGVEGGSMGSIDPHPPPPLFFRFTLALSKPYTKNPVMASPTFQISKFKPPVTKPWIRPRLYPKICKLSWSPFSILLQSSGRCLVVPDYRGFLT